MTYANVLASGAMFIALGGGAYAATGGFVGSKGTVHGCVSPAESGEKGELRIIKSGQKCAQGETALSFNTKGSRGARGKAGVAGKPGAPGAEGKEGKQGPPGISGQTRWGNVLVEKGHETLLAEVGHFKFIGRCESGGSAVTVKETTTEGNSIEDEDSYRTYDRTFNVGVEVTGDEDYDEAGYERDNTTGLTLQYLDYSFDAGKADENACEFQGTITQTS
jgi:hypothetical protein